MRQLLTLLLCVLIGAGSGVAGSSAKVNGYYRRDGTYVHSYARTSRHVVKSESSRVPASRRAAGVPRDKHGRIKRSRAARSAFVRKHPCPATGRRNGPCHGYVVDHINPLECGGPDAPSNMQWQTVAEAKIKDRTEGKCRR